MTSLLILTQKADTHSTQRLLEEANHLKLSAKCCNPFEQDLHLSQVHNYNAKYAIHRITGVNFDDFDLSFAKILQHSGVKVINDPFSLALIRDKEKQNVLFQMNGVPHIPTFIFRGPPKKNLENTLQETFSFYLKDDEFILKTIRGNRGVGTNLIKGKESLFSFLETFHAMRDQRFILQPRVHFQEEMRVLILRGEIIGGIQRRPSKDHFKGNLGRSSNGAKFIRPNQFSENLKNICEQLNSLSRLHFFALDCIKYKEENLVLEINPVPGFEVFEKVSKINVAKLVLKGLYL